MDNQKTLNGVNAQVKRDRDYEERVGEAIAERSFGDKWKSSGESSGAQDASGEEMQVNIDSPTTINYPQPTVPPSAVPPPLAAPAKSLAARLAPWLLAGLGLPAAGLAGYLLSPDKPPEQPPAVVDTDTDTYTQIEAVQIYQPEIEP